MNLCPLRKIPDENGSLETHESLLSTGDVFPSFWDGDNWWERLTWDGVIMSPEESLSFFFDVPEDDGGPKRIHKMLVIRVQDKRFWSLPRKSNDSLDVNLFFHTQIKINITSCWFHFIIMDKKSQTEGD